MIKAITTTKYVDKDENCEYVFMPVDDTLTIEKTDGGYKVKYLTIEDDPISPDEDADDGYFLVHYHRSFWIERDKCNKNILGYIYTGNESEYDKDGADELLKTHYCFLVDAYIHSGVCLRFAGEFTGMLPQGHEQFDVSSVGAVLINKDEFKTKAEAEKSARGHIEYWNQYLSGDVYCCVVEKWDKDKEPIDYDVVGGYSGFDSAKECLASEF